MPPNASIQGSCHGKLSVTLNIGNADLAAFENLLIYFAFWMEVVIYYFYDIQYKDRYGTSMMQQVQ